MTNATQTRGQPWVYVLNCRRPESNRHAPFGARDFKSLVSTNSTTPAIERFGAKVKKSQHDGVVHAFSERRLRLNVCDMMKLEGAMKKAASGFEPEMEVLQTSALPLG